MKIALTGGTGFIGGHVFDNTAGRGIGIKALTRRPQPARPGVEWIRGSLEDEDSLKNWFHPVRPLFIWRVLSKQKTGKPSRISI